MNGSLATAALAVSCVVTLLVTFFPRRRQRDHGPAVGGPRAWSLALAMLATLFTSVSMLETTGRAYRDGSVGIDLAVSLAITVASIALIGGRFAARRAVGEVTLVQTIASHYGGSSALTLLVTAVGLLFALGVVVLQLATADAVWATVAPGGRAVGVLVLAGLAATVALGGRRGLARTLSLHGEWLLLTLLVTALTTVRAAWRHAEGTSATGPEPVFIAWLGVVPVSAALAVQPALWLRYGQASSPRSLRGAALIVLFLAGLGFLAFAGIIGKGARTVYPPQVDSQWNQRPNAAVDAGGMGFDRVLPTLLVHQVPTSFGAAGPLIAAVALAGLLAASVGAAAVNLRAIGLLLALDVPFAFGRPAWRGVGVEWASRIVATSIALAATWLVVADHRPGAFRPLTLAAEVIIFGPAFLLQLLPVTIDCLYLRRGSRGGAATGLFAGIVVLGGFSPLVAFVVERIVPAAGPWLVRLAEHFDPALTALTVNVATFVVVSLFAKARTTQPRS